MQTITSSYAPGRSPFARLLRDTRRQIVNLRAWEYADWSLARWKRIDPTDKARITQLENDRKVQAGNVGRFQDCLINSYGVERAERIRRIASAIVFD